MPRIIRCEECGAEKTISVGNDETKWRCAACSQKPEKATKKVQQKKSESRKSIWTGTADVQVKKIVHSEKRPLIRKQVLCTVCGSGMIGETKNNTGIQAWGCLFMIIGLFLTPILIGIPIIVVGLIYGAKKRYLWVCPNCGVFFERA